LQSKKEFLDDIAVSLGGYIAEQMIFGDLTTGPSSDLQVATAIARDMVTKYGMSDKLGPVALEGGAGNVLLGRGVGEKEYSETMSTEIDNEVSRIVDDSYSRAKEVLINHRDALDTIAEELVNVETMERAEFEKLLILHGIKPKKIEEESEK